MSSNILKINGTYRHFKGNEYIVIGKGIYTESGEVVVIYRKKECKDTDDIIMYARPIDMFLSEVDHNKYPDVKQKYRFELIS